MGRTDTGSVPTCGRNARVGIQTGNRAEIILKQTLFYTSGSDFASNRPCFTSAGQTLLQTDPVLNQRVRLYPKQTLDENKILIPIPEAVYYLGLSSEITLEKKLSIKI